MADCWRQRTKVWRKGTRPARPQALLAYKRSCAFFEGGEVKEGFPRREQLLTQQSSFA